MLPEILDRDATGDVAAIYARIRAAQGTSVVNFIWRHLAAIDGALEWAWPRAEAALPSIGRAAEPAVRCADAAVAGIAQGMHLVVQPEQAMDVLRTYERGNAWNMVAMTLLTHLRAGVTAPEATGPATPPVPGTASVAPLPRYDALMPDCRALVDRLAAAGPAAESGVRPSLWVHLALWPDLLHRVADACIPVLGSPAFHAAHARLQDQAAELLGLPPVPAGVPPAARPAAPIDAAIGRFRRRIPEMLLIGRVLVRAHYSA